MNRSSVEKCLDDIELISDHLIEQGYDTVVLLVTRYNRGDGTTDFFKHKKGNDFAAMQSLAVAYEDFFEEASNADTEA